MWANRLNYEQRMHSLKSWGNHFSYNISRKHPSRWFKWVVTVVFTLLFGFFTVFNLALSGYDLQLKHTFDPNGTQAEYYWFNHPIFTWGDDKLKPVCQEEDLQVGFQFMTTNMGLSYTIKAITNDTESSNELARRSSIPYLNNSLRNCRVNSVNVYLRKADDSLPEKANWWSWMFNYADADAQCEVINAAGTFTMRFGVSYAGLAKVYDYVAVDNYRTHASVWWGTRLLNNYFNGIQNVMAKVSISPQETFTNGQLGYIALPATSIKDYKIFNVTYYLLVSDGTIINEANDKLDLEQLYNNGKALESRPLTEGLSFAKVFSSLVLVDLGESQAPNLLLDSELLQYALDPPDNFNREVGGPLNNGIGLDWWKYRGISPPGKPVVEENSVPMDQCYEKFKHQMGPLGTKTASIYTQYSCSVPVKKSTATIILLLLVANYVVLQTAWAIMVFFRDLLVSKDPKAMYCEGCFKQNQGVAMMSYPYRDLSSPEAGKSISQPESSSTRGLLRDDDLEETTSVRFD